ncbi:MAG: putative esterase [Xanthobacteraceae bacterium]|nr:MAG: putative esterase [Xanthobacteraceae bacterium]
MSALVPLWSGLTPQEHEFQYNPQAAFPDFKNAQAGRTAANAVALTRLAREADIAFGDHPLRRLDVYPSDRGGAGPKPVHVFLHGGYWRAQDKQNFAFIAEPLVAEGVVTVVTNYELCPASTLDAASSTRGPSWARRSISRSVSQRISPRAATWSVGL